MKSFIKQCKSLISGTLAMTVIISNLSIPAVVQGISVQEADYDISSTDITAFDEVSVIDGSIDFVTESSIANDSFVSSTSLLSNIPSVTTTVLSYASDNSLSLKKASMAEENGYKYYISNGKAVIDSYTGEDSELVIPDTLGGLSVTEIGYAAFAGNKNIVSATIPETVLRINHDAFNGCIALESVILPDSITSIQDGAFSGCIKLKSIQIPDSISRIEDNTFMGCEGLTDISLNSTIDYIGKNAFAKCISLTDFNIPESVTAIGNMAFVGSGLTSIEIPETVTSLGYSIFADCQSLKDVKFPESITILKSSSDKGMFSNCSMLENVVLSETLTEIGDYTFSGCTSLTNIKLPETVTKIGKGVFKDCIHLDNFSIPELVTRIDDSTFCNCTSLSSIDIHDGIDYLGICAFQNCDSLSEIYVPLSVSYIGGGAFAQCDVLKKVSLPDTITELNSSDDLGLFTDDIALTDLKIPVSLSTIGSFSFKNCRALKEIAIPGTVAKIEKSAFEGCSALTEITIPEKVSVLSENAFSNCSSLTKAVLPEKIDIVRNFAFAGCSVLSDIGNKASYFKFDENTFKGCNSLNDKRATVFKDDSPVVSVSSAANIVGGIANFSVKYNLNDWICSGMTNNQTVSFELSLPEGLVLIESSVFTDSDDNKVSFAGNNSIFSVEKPRGTIHFSARIDAYTDSAYIVKTRMFFNSYNYNWTQSLPEMALTIPKLTISAQSTVSNLNCDVYGIAEPGKKVKIYFGNKIVGETTANKYTGKYIATINLPKNDESNEYSIYAVCGMEQTDSIKVTYSVKTPSISKVELIYCSHAPTNLNKYDETLDITGIFTKGERPVIQYYPAGSMRFKITTSNSDRIDTILVRSKKGSDSKYLWADYDEKEEAWITPEGKYFDESNHNYVPGSLNFIIIHKPDEIIPEVKAQKLIDYIDLSNYDSENIKIDDSSSIIRLNSKSGKRLTDCYFYSADKFTIDGKVTETDKIVENAEDYGFRKAYSKIELDGKLFNVYFKTLRNYNASANGLAGNFDKSVFEQIDEAYTTYGKSHYEIDDYYAFARVISPDDGSVPSHIYIESGVKEPNNIQDRISWSPAPFLDINNQFVINPIKVYADENEEDDDSDNGFDFDKFLDKGTEHVQNFTDFIASLTDVANEEGSFFGPVYNSISGGADLVRANTHASDRYDEVMSNLNPNSSAYETNVWLTDLERNWTVFSTFIGDFAGRVDYGYSSSLLDVINEGLADIFDFQRYKNDQISECFDAIDGVTGNSNSNSNTAYRNDGHINTVIDPSGIVYEGIKSNTVSGAVVTCYILNEDTGKWEKWNAEDYDQINPLITDDAGSYAWDVPEGRYYVTCEKEGFDLIKSEEFEVPPPKFDLDFNLINTSVPGVKSYTLGENSITIKFTKVMDISTINNESVSVGNVKGDITIEPQLYLADDKYTDTFIIKGDFRTSTDLTLKINNKARDYTGTEINEYSADITNDYADLILNAKTIELLENRTFKITGNKEIVSFTSSDSKIATVDEKGLVKAISSGEATITAVDKVGKEAVIIAQVKNIENSDNVKRIRSWAIIDYQGKTMKKVDSSEVSAVSDNKLEIKMKDKNGNILDVYTVDADTAEGTNSSGEIIVLPQTGNNSMLNILIIFGAFSMIGIGLFTVMHSGIFRRKENKH